jgi:hypothetical protein
VPFENADGLFCTRVFTAKPLVLET